MVKVAKRPTAVPDFLRPAVDAIVSAESDASLAAALTGFDAPHGFERPEERSLLNWTDALDRLDAVLARRVAAATAKAPLLPPTPSAGSPAAPAAAASGEPAAPAALATSGGAAVAADAIATVPAAEADSAGAAAGEGGARGPARPPPPLELVLLVLRASLRLVRNASHDTKHLYSSVDSLTALLADAEPSVVVLALEVLHALLQRQQRGRTSRTMPRTLDAVGRLYALSHGWGGREVGLGLVECCSAAGAEPGRLPAAGAAVRLESQRDDMTQFAAGNHALLSGPAATGARVAAELALATARVAERPRGPGAAGNTGGIDAAAAAGPGGGETVAPAAGGIEGLPAKLARESGPKPVVLHIADVRTLRDDEQWLLDTFMSERGIPPPLRYPFLTAVRRARAFVAGREARLELVRIRLLAVSCLALFHPAPSVMANVFAHDTELVADVVALAKSDAAHGLGDLPVSLRVLAVRVLSTICPDRHRFSQLLTSAGVASHHGILPSMLRAQVAALVAAAEASSPPSPVDAGGLSIQLAEAVVGLVHNVASCAAGPGPTGAMALVSSGALGAMIPLLSDRDPRHARVVTQAIRAMECIIETTNASSGGTAFRDHSGLSLLIDRIVAETGVQAMPPGGGGGADDDDDAVVAADDEENEARGRARGGARRRAWARMRGPKKRRRTSAWNARHSRHAANRAACTNWSAGGSSRRWKR
jgi:hypothetical protein